MAQDFDTFILLAEMRTGSNFLEDTLNTLPGLRCWGEAFNPAFVGHADKTELAGVTMQQRETDPLRLLSALRAQTDGMAGFRFFHDHDPRILRHALDDRRCAKVILTRNPLDSFVSLEIARQTGQWRLGDLKNARSARITFDAARFSQHLAAVQGFQQDVLRALQVSGQTAFYIRYEDINDIEILNGLAAHLGVASRLTATSGKTKVQNPDSLREKVVNYDEMVAALSQHDHFDLGRTPNFEQRRGPNVPAWVVGARSPLLYMPVPGGFDDPVPDWLTALDGAAPVSPGGAQKDLRKWKRQHPGHRSFTVVRHPLTRIHGTFLRHILPVGDVAFAGVRATLINRYDVPLPEDGQFADAAAHRAAFLGFLRFARGNLAGQTSLRTDPAWATQSAIVQGMAQFMLPDMILRDAGLTDGLHALARQIGKEAPAVPPVADRCAAVRDPEVSALVRDIYRRDYLMFGFSDLP